MSFIFTFTHGRCKSLSLGSPEASIEIALAQFYAGVNKSNNKNFYFG